MLLLGIASTSVEIGEDLLNSRVDRGCEQSWVPQREPSSAGTSWAAHGQHRPALCLGLQKLFAFWRTNKNHTNTQVKTASNAKPDKEHEVILNQPKTVGEEFALSNHIGEGGTEV